MAYEVVSIQEGDRIDYTPGSALAVGQVVVQVDLIGINTVAIASGVLGSLAVEGIFEFPKGVLSTDAIPAGTILYWDPVNEVVTATAGSLKQVGKAVLAAAAAATTVRVKLTH